MKTARLFLALLLFAAPFAGRSLAAETPEKRVAFYEGGRRGPCTFKVELAVTPEEQARGLMFRERLAPDRGMLFVFDRDEARFFWMRNTLIPLDMIFIASSLEVVHVHHSARPQDETSVSSKFAAQYVLEVSGGRAAACGIKAGTKARLINLSR
jgi:uncharacterized protein